jgi:hypothetical protein
MLTLRVALPLLFGLGLAACSGGPGKSGSASSPTYTLDGYYQGAPVGNGPGIFTEAQFSGNKYALMTTEGCSTGKSPCEHDGTFAIDGTTLALTDAVTGKTAYWELSDVQTAATSSQSFEPSLHTQGGQPLVTEGNDKLLAEAVRQAEACNNNLPTAQTECGAVQQRGTTPPPGSYLFDNSKPPGSPN